MPHSLTAEHLPKAATCAGDSPHRIQRRALLASGLAIAGVCGLPLLRRAWAARESVFVVGGQRYDGPLEQTIRDGLIAVDIEPAAWRGKHVVLKPNLVEPSRSAPHMTTHPAVVLATADVFRRAGARVTVAEGPGHVRDGELALYESGLGEALDTADLSFVDANYDRLARRPNRGRNSVLDEFCFAATIANADLVVSLPKLKTHHWVGMTAAMKNLYGTLPGIKYGWPKNVLHWAGIPQTVVDIAASLPPTVAVVDCILCMEGDGPIMGTPKTLGSIAVGANLAALDATCARMMGLAPERIPYLRLAAGRLGPIDDRHIEQRGDPWQRLASPFEILDVPHLEGLRATT